MATHPAPLSGIAEDGHGDDDDELSSSSGSDGHGSDDARGEDARAPRRFDSALQSSGVFSRGGSWYFMPGDPGDAAPPGPPPNLAYWMPPDDPHAPGHWGDSSQLSVQESLAGAAFVPYPMPPAGGDPSQSYSDLAHLLPPEEEFKVYPSRWVMLFYMSLLNLLSDWTCFSVAPIATLTTSAFDLDDPDRLVTVFLFANALASAMEPAILGRLGLRKTVLFGAFVLMIGSMVKSGGIKQRVIGPTGLEGEQEEEQSFIWRLYLGFFLVGLSQPLYQCTPALLSASWFPESERTMATGMALNSNQLGIGCAFVSSMLVKTEQDILPYFGVLSLISTITFVGVALQFDDAPPTPPSETARVIKGDLVIKLPRHFTKFMGRFINLDASAAPSAEIPGAGGAAVETEVVDPTTTAESEEGADAANDKGGNSEDANHEEFKEAEDLAAPPAPVPSSRSTLWAQPNHPLCSSSSVPNLHGVPPSPGYPVPTGPGMGYSTTGSAFYHGYDQEGHYYNSLLDGGMLPFDGDDQDEGAEPILTQLDHELDIDIRDDQIVQQFKACFRRKGFSHCVVAFTTGGIVINTLSTFMDYLVTIGSEGGSIVGIVGGVFQALIMCSSLVIGGLTDHSRKYYFVILSMLVFGAFSLSICNVLLDSDSAVNLRWALLLVAVLAGPLQPISTELGVEVVYPLSENTVLVIQQLFSNLLSAIFIEIFKALKDVGTARGGPVQMPEYTCSFYMLIIIHSLATCYFATYNGLYLRYEAELKKKEEKIDEKHRLLSELHMQQEKARYGATAPN